MAESRERILDFRSDLVSVRLFADLQDEKDNNQKGYSKRNKLFVV